MLRPITILYLIAVVMFRAHSQEPNLINAISTSSSVEEYYLLLGNYYKNSDPEKSFHFYQISLQHANVHANTSIKADVYSSMGESYMHRARYDTALHFYNQALPLYFKAGNDTGISTVLNNIGALFYYQGEFETAIDYFKKVLIVEQNLGEKEGSATTLNNIGAIYSLKGDYANSISYYEKSLEMKLLLKDEEGIAYAYNNIGYVYDMMGYFEKAMEYYMNALEYCDKADNKQLKGVLYNNIASIYRQWKMYDKALEYHDLSLTMKEETDNTLGIAHSLNNIGLIYQDKGDYNEALSYYLAAKDMFEKNKNKNGIATLCNNLGSVNILLNKPQQAKEYLNQALLISEEINSHYGILKSYLNFGKLYSHLKQYTIAEQYLNRINDYDQNHVESELQLQALQELIKIYEATGNYQKALSTFRQLENKKDSLFNETTLKQFSEIQTLYDVQAKNNQIILLEKENLVQKLTTEAQSSKLTRERNLRYFLISGFILTIIFITVLSLLYKQKQESYKVLMKKNLELIGAKPIDNMMNMENMDIQFDSEYSDQEKYSKSTLSNEQKANFLSQIESIINDSKSFLNAQYTIEDMASEIGTNRKYLSQVINETYKVNFSNFINELRIKEACKMLANPSYKHMSLQGIGETVGFHSKASFNTAFKKFTGLTPSYFQKSIEQ